jgi:hypothetical protein
MGYMHSCWVLGVVELAKLLLRIYCGTNGVAKYVTVAQVKCVNANEAFHLPTGSNL